MSVIQWFQISFEEYIGLLKARSMFTNQRQVRAMFSLAGGDGDGFLNNSELRNELKRLERANKAFVLFDKDRDGAVSCTEFMKVLI